jgi:bifunctional non-homologous end joining protein LigD
LQAAPLKEPRAALAEILRPVKHGVHLSDHVEADGPIVFRHACMLGVEGVVSKRKGSPYRSGRTRLAQVEEPGLAGDQA